jgi:hypothetical protein
VTKRRDAKQTRNDQVKSRRDYQEIVTRHGVHVSKKYGKVSCVGFEKRVNGGVLDVVGMGGYVYPSRECVATVSMQISGITVKKMFPLICDWNRFGIAANLNTDDICVVQISFNPALESVDFFGLNAGGIDVSVDLDTDSDRAKILSSSHLAPETFYLPHNNPLGIEIHDCSMSRFEITDGGKEINLKKCSYCQRYLPLDRARPSALAYHKHNSKLTGHQNECRACKKWRINNHFNPIRTSDQYHESSTINRERSQFLREPVILQSIKDKNGDGLKSIVWKKFKKRCFKCGERLTIGEVQLDHTRPFAYLWPIDEHATCLCATCNNHKKDRFPVDFYGPEELEELSNITGLSLNNLRKKEICQNELKRIVDDISYFAKGWDPRTFNAIARKVRELEPTTDLFDILKRQDRNTYEKLMVDLQNRPPSLGSEDV